MVLKTLHYFHHTACYVAALQAYYISLYREMGVLSVLRSFLILVYHNVHRVTLVLLCLRYTMCVILYHRYIVVTLYLGYTVLYTVPQVHCSHLPTSCTQCWSFFTPLSYYMYKAAIVTVF